MNIEFSEDFVIEAIKNYLNSMGHIGRVERFERNLTEYPVKGIMINDNLNTSVIQLTDEVKDNDDLYYDGVLIIPYRFWLMASDSTKHFQEFFNEKT